MAPAKFSRAQNRQWTSGVKKAWQQGLNWLLGPHSGAQSSQEVQDEQQALGSCFLTSTSPSWHIFCADCFGDIVEEHPDLSVLEPTFSGAPPCSSACMCTQLLQSCLTLCNPTDCSPPGSSVHGILQARILEWVAVPSSRGIFPIQGSNLRLLHCRWILLLLSHWGIPHVPETVSIPGWSLHGPGCLLLIPVTPC